jgi:hypothetical protein
MVEPVETLRKEWRFIRAAPWSLVIVSATAIGLIWGGFQWFYHAKLSDSDRLAAQWKSSADYWKDEATRPKPVEPAPTSALPTPHPRETKHTLPPKQDVTPVVINAAGGIPITGGNVTNPTVINAAPPPARLSFIEETVSALPAGADGEKAFKIHIKTDRSIPGAVIGIICSGPFELSKGGGTPDDPTLKGASISQLTWGGPLSRNNSPVPNSFAITVNAPAAFMPGQELIVPVKSKTDVHVLQVMTVNAGGG